MDRHKVWRTRVWCVGGASFDIIKKLLPGVIAGVTDIDLVMFRGR